VHGDASGVSGTIAGPSWKLLLEIMAETVLEPTYPRREFERQRERMLSRMLIEDADPRVQAARRFRQLVYGDHWLGRPVHGNSESLASLKAADLRRHHAAHWVGQRLLIGVCGDVDPRAVHRVLDRALGKLKPGKGLEQGPEKLPRPGVRVAAYRASRAQVHLYLGHLGIRRNNPDYAPLVVMDHVLGTGPGFTNRISRRLRDDLGLAYSVHADIHTSAGLRPGTFTAYIGTSPDTVETALAGYMREMRLMQDERVGARELDMAKSYLTGSFCMGFERASRRAGYLVSSEVFGLPADNLERLPREFAAVTARDVQRVAREHLWPDACCLAASGPISSRELSGLLGATRTGSRGRAKATSGRGK
jgi:zinc protease